MNRIFSHLLAVTAVVVFSGAVHAQSSAGEASPPREPILSRAPQQSEWTVEIRYDPAVATGQFLSKEEKKAGEANPEPTPPTVFRPVQIRVSKDNKVYREVTTWSDGAKTEKWIVDGLQIRELPRSGRLSRVDMNSYSENFSDYRRSDFEVAEWVDKESYRGVRTVKGQLVYEFQPEAGKKRITPRERSLGEDGGGAQSPAGDTVAYLDAKTQLPLFVRDNGAVWIYKDFSSGSSLAVPERFSAEFQKWKELIAKRTRVPTPP